MNRSRNPILLTIYRRRSTETELPRKNLGSLPLRVPGSRRHARGSWRAIGRNLKAKVTIGEGGHRQCQKALASRACKRLARAHELSPFCQRIRRERPRHKEVSDTAADENVESTLIPARGNSCANS